MSQIASIKVFPKSDLGHCQLSRGLLRVLRHASTEKDKLSSGAFKTWLPYFPHFFSSWFTDPLCSALMTSLAKEKVYVWLQVLPPGASKLQVLTEKLTRASEGPSWTLLHSFWSTLSISSLGTSNSPWSVADGRVKNINIGRRRKEQRKPINLPSS